MVEEEIAKVAEKINVIEEILQTHSNDESWDKYRSENTVVFKAFSLHELKLKLIKLEDTRGKLEDTRGKLQDEKNLLQDEKNLIRQENLLLAQNASLTGK